LQKEEIRVKIKENTEERQREELRRKKCRLAEEKE
jgi:hypothetical protein